MVKGGISWGVNVRKTRRNGDKWLTKVKEMQNLWQFKFLYPCQKKPSAKALGFFNEINPLRDL